MFFHFLALRFSIFSLFRVEWPFSPVRIHSAPGSAQADLIGEEHRTHEQSLQTVGALPVPVGPDGHLCAEGRLAVIKFSSFIFFL